MKLSKPGSVGKIYGYHSYKIEADNCDKNPVIRTGGIENETWKRGAGRLSYYE